MKIITNDKAYVQKNDLAYLISSDLPIPASLFMNAFGTNPVIIDDNNRYEFVEFNEEIDIKYFQQLNWIIDYNETKDLTEDEIITLGKSIADKQNEIAEKYNAMSDKEKEKNINLVEEHELLEFKMYSLRDVLLIKQGLLKIELPDDINYSSEINSSYENTKEKGVKKLIKTIFNRKKN